MPPKKNASASPKTPAKAAAIATPIANTPTISGPVAVVPVVASPKVEAKKDAAAVPSPSPSPAKNGKNKKEGVTATEPAVAAATPAAASTPSKQAGKGKKAAASVPSDATPSTNNAPVAAAAAPVAAAAVAAPVVAPKKEKAKKDTAAAPSTTTTTETKAVAPSTTTAAPAVVGETYDTAHIFVASAFPEWQQQVLKVLQGLFAGAAGSDYKEKKVEAKEISAALKVTPGFNEPSQKKQLSNAMAFASGVVTDVAARGKDALELSMPFDEEKLLREHIEFITRDLGLKNIDIRVTNTETANAGGQASGAGVKPGQPAINFIANTIA